MIDYIRRLLVTGAAYTASSIVAKLFALATLPLYTRYVAAGDYGKVEVLLSAVVVLSIVFRLGVIEALLRFYHDPGRRRTDVVGTAFWTLLLTTTVGAALCLAAVPLISELLLRGEDSDLVRIAVVGFWFFTFYELLLALYRVDERPAPYATATIANVFLTIPLTVWLVVIEERGAEGLLLGNFIGTGLIVLVLFVLQANRLGRPRLPELRPMLKFGLPTMPAELSLYALNFTDRVLLVGLAGSRAQGLVHAGLYSMGVKFAQAITVWVRAFQLAWPPLAYSITDHDEARRVYGRILTYYVLATAAIVTVLALVSRWLVRLLDPSYFDAHTAVPLIATGVALYGAYLVLVASVARKNRTFSLFPVAAAGLAVNVVLCLWLIPEYDIVGAGFALIGAYVTLFGLLLLRAREVLGLRLEWGRIARVLIAAGIVTAAGELLLPTDGWDGLALRLLIWLGYPLLLIVSGFFRPGELGAARSLPAVIRQSRAGSAQQAGDPEVLPDGTQLMQRVDPTE